uniref:Uncharacterized protein n=1 Tax=Kwoniella dejecticola CBS 10117 TaxID=1296121 RepID=A0A1A6ADD7_9TREE|nr:uncharacterized protein I303_02276 [Kwoniella dejecticola CBS 10117]OBR88058.1 hypothetical protein I303_02276 [Kwoniella dejecticola CBS 10117]
MPEYIPYLYREIVIPLSELIYQPREQISTLHWMGIHSIIITLLVLHGLHRKYGYPELEGPGDEYEWENIGILALRESDLPVPWGAKKENVAIDGVLGLVYDVVCYAYSSTMQETIRLAQHTDAL